jgi:hypothetical protein
VAVINCGRRLLFERNSVSDQHSEREADTLGRWADPLPDGREKRTSLLHFGDLFHVSARFPRQPKAARVDRLAGILRKGLLAPAYCQDGSVCSDLHLVVTGTEVSYDNLVFLHRFGPQSSIYTLGEPGRFMVFVDLAIPVLTPEAMGPSWVVLCQDEVYVRDRIPPEDVVGVAVHRTDADSVMSDLIDDFRRLSIPLYDYDGNVLWQPARAENRLGLG